MCMLSNVYIRYFVVDLVPVYFLPAVSSMSDVSMAFPKVPNGVYSSLFGHSPAHLVLVYVHACVQPQSAAMRNRLKTALYT